MNGQEKYNVTMTASVYPYVVNTLSTMIGKKLLIETVRNTDTGYIIDVKPDHIVLKNQQDDPTTYILISQIVSIMLLD